LTLFAHLLAAAPQVISKKATAALFPIAWSRCQPRRSKRPNQSIIANGAALASGSPIGYADKWTQAGGLLQARAALIPIAPT
jgi:hypothetical protein